MAVSSATSRTLRRDGCMSLMAAHVVAGNPWSVPLDPVQTRAAVGCGAYSRVRGHATNEANRLTTTKGTVT